MVMKKYIAYNDIHKICAQTANKIIESGFKPDLLLAIGGGGFIPARILRTFLKVPIKSVSMELYNDVTDEIGEHVIIKQWIDESDIKDKNILVVDEVDDTRMTLYSCVEKLRQFSPKTVAAFVVFNKLKKKTKGGHWDDKSVPPTNVNVDHYWPGESVADVWLVYPWEALDIDEHTQLSYMN
jgi:hypoxanthine phosphoribosyltransferase